MVPKVIRMQSKRLSATQEQEALTLLREHGYRVAAGVAPERHITAVSAQLAQHMLRVVDAHSEDDAGVGGAAGVAVGGADASGGAVTDAPLGA